MNSIPHKRKSKYVETPFIRISTVNGDYRLENEQLLLSQKITKEQYDEYKNHPDMREQHLHESIPQITECFSTKRDFIKRGVAKNFRKMGMETRYSGKNNTLYVYGINKIQDTDKLILIDYLRIGSPFDIVIS